MIPLYDDNPTTKAPVVTILFLVTNVAIFLFQVLSPAQLEYYIYSLGAIPWELTHLRDMRPLAPIPLPLTLFTAMFMHAGFMHLAGNMLYLWIFGNNVEDAFGHFGFTIFYLTCGLAAAFGHVLFNLNSRIPMVGASGAIAGVLGAYMVLYPRARVHTLIPFPFFFQILPIPAFLVLGLWFVFQLLSAGVGSGGGIAFMAHVAGFVAGVAIVLVFPVRRRALRLPR
ncbi:MAG: rhomboid family intramembrane serine protease [Acidobacteria bacterium]|nr:rhomboid family intramembrane serine protease [Acidobacteriota bacterium]